MDCFKVVLCTDYTVRCHGGGRAYINSTMAIDHAVFPESNPASYVNTPGVGVNDYSALDVTSRFDVDLPRRGTYELHGRMHAS